MTISINTGSGTPESTAAPEGHDQEMLDAVDAKEAELLQEDKLGLETEEPEGKTEEVPSKEEPSEDPEEEPEEPTEDETEDPSEEEAKEVAENLGLDYEAAVAEYEETGELSEETRAKWVKAGVPEAVIDAHLEGQELKAEQLRQDVFSTVGGEDNYEKMIEWASANLEAAEIERFNNAVNSGDFSQIKSAVELVGLKYQNAQGVTPNLIQGETNSNTVQDKFESTAQLTAAMGDPRYATDPAYRKEVEEKLARSEVF